MFLRKEKTCAAQNSCNFCYLNLSNRETTKQGNFYSRNIVHNDICIVKIGVNKIGLRMYIEERERCRAMTCHRPRSLEPFINVAAGIMVGLVYVSCLERSLYGTASWVFWDIFLRVFLVCVANITTIGQSID